ncbi:MAG: hypothetical protein IPH33_16435 [Bacteroidetes bacterium]|nr:hypothetical protein [Bacteroidota bacterium]
MSDTVFISDKKPISISTISILMVFVFWWGFFIHYHSWKEEYIKYDAISYYAYLPAQFIHHDITLEFTKSDPDVYMHQFWPETTDSGKLVIKTTMGLCYLYAPFFFAANIIAPAMGYDADGFTQPYQTAMMISAFFFLVLGVFYLRKFLRLYFDDSTTAITIFFLYFSTNWMWYTTGQPVMSHGYLFSLTAVLLYTIVRWYKEATYLRSLIIGLLYGLIILIRPTMIIFLIPFILYDFKAGNFWKERIALFWKRKMHFVLMIIVAFLIGLPQLLYWHKITGHWLFFSYNNERFFWDNPHIFEGLLGFRKGWLIYSPIMVLSIIGLFLMKGNEKVFKPAVIITFMITIYVVWSWWAWWYGGSYGQRPLIDFYPLLALPLASTVYTIRMNFRKLKYVTIGVAFLFYVGAFQNWQYMIGLIHYDSNTKESYMINFLSATYRPGWIEALQAPDYESAKRGLSSYGKPGKPRIEFDYKKYAKENFFVKKTTFLDGVDQYTRALDIPYSDLKEMNIDSIYISANAFCLETINTNNFMGVFSLMKDTTLIQTYAKDFCAKTYMKEKSWTNVQVAMKYNDTLFNVADRLRIFANDVVLRDVYLKDYFVGYTKN